MYTGNRVNFAFILNSFDNVCLRCENHDNIKQFLNMLNYICHLPDHWPHRSFCVAVLLSNTAGIYSLLLHLHSGGGPIHSLCHSASHIWLRVLHTIYEVHFSFPNQQSEVSWLSFTKEMTIYSSNYI